MEIYYSSFFLRMLSMIILESPTHKTAKQCFVIIDRHVASIPGRLKYGLVPACVSFSPKSGKSPFLSLIYFLSLYISLALYCVVPEGFHTSLKPEEALIYLYDGCMVRMSYLGSVQAMGSVWCLKLLLAKTTRL